MASLAAMETSDWCIVGATIVGPILAVQAQRIVDNIRAFNERKNEIFSTLMATRAARLGAEHVKALNAIETTFYGRRYLRWVWQTGRERQVVLRWQEYFAKLDHKLPDSANESETAEWNASAFELFVNLLSDMAKERRYAFDRNALTRHHYSPKAHSTLEFQLNAIRTFVLEVLSGNRLINVRVWPLPPVSRDDAAKKVNERS